MIFQAFGNGIPGFEVPWPFAAIFLLTDSESFVLAVEINKTKMSKRRGKKTQIWGRGERSGRGIFPEAASHGKNPLFDWKTDF